MRNPTAVPFGAINPKTGDVVFYHEYYVSEKTLPVHAKALKPQFEEIPVGLMRFMVIDPACKNRMNDVINGKSVLTHFQEYGIYFSPGNNNLEYGISKVASYIEAGKIKIYKTCVNLVDELLKYTYPETDIDNADENQDEKPEKKHDHLCDAMRYAIARLPDDPHSLVSASYTPPKSYADINYYDTLDEFDADNKEMYDDYLAYY